MDIPITDADVFQAFGLETPAAAVVPPVTVVPPVDNTPANDSSVVTETPPNTTEVIDNGVPPATQNNEPVKPAQQQPVPVVVDKTNQAFAAMRTQNKQYADVIKGIASVLGVKDENPDQIMQAVNNAITAAQAKQQNVPVALLTEMQTLKNQLASIDQVNLAQSARSGFDSIKADFALNDAEVAQFATDLAKANINPFEKKVDLKQEYITRNYATILAKAEARGAAQEAARVAKVNNNSTSPNSTTSVGGAGGTQSKQINSVSELERFIEEMSPKK